ncbi:membrane-associating domain-containing protein [Leptodontidium sp. 2 PMI_412]|nr:membrane-associating domain-containing protein [Leptodontidium sp. 2 PMI_412]
MTPKYYIPLRILQAVFCIVVLALSSYVAFIQNQTGYHSATQINFLIFVPSFSILSLLFLELTPQFAPKASNQYLNLGLQGLVSGLYLAGFIALSVFLGQLKYCQGSICTATKVDAVFGALSYTVWMASTATLGIEMSRFGLRYESTGASTEKVVDKGVLV